MAKPVISNWNHIWGEKEKIARKEMHMVHCKAVNKWYPYNMYKNGSGRSMLFTREKHLKHAIT